jgi:hypothetical protein
VTTKEQQKEKKKKRKEPWKSKMTKNDKMKMKARQI